jgi:hypothetical protein
VTVRVLVMLDLYFVSVKYVFVKCKAGVCLCEAFENLKVQVKRVTFGHLCNFIKVQVFCKHVFLILPFVKIYI